LNPTLKYNLWKTVISTDLGRTYKAIISNFPSEKTNSQKQLNLDINNGGSFIHARVITWGVEKGILN
jgi:hypothetical protein